MIHKTLWAVACGVALAVLVSQPALAQGRMGGAMGPRYDPKTEMAVKGMVEEVTESPSPVGGSRTGTHVTLKTDGGNVAVHLGPTEYWQKNGVELTKGDAIEVTGSKVKTAEGDIVLAREVKKGDKTVTLRDARGVPAWFRGRRSSS